MKTEKSMKAKKVTVLSVLIALAALAITLLSVFLPKHSVAQAVTDREVKTSQSEQTLSQIEDLEAEYQKSFDAHAGLWEKYFVELQKLDEIPDDFDEKTFIANLSTMTEEEKATLLKNVELLDELDAKLDKLYDELFDAEEDALYDDYCQNGCCDFAETDEEYFADYDEDMSFVEDEENFFGDDFFRMCDEAETANDEVQALRKEFDDVVDARIELWDKVYASYDELDENFDYANFDEAKYIAELSALTAEEKDTLLKDLAKLDEIAAKLSALCGANCGR